MRQQLAVSILVSLLALACGSATTGGVAPTASLADEFKDAPEWVRSMACSEPAVKTGEKVVCGVGSHQIKAVQQINLGRRAALAEAAAAVALVIKGKVETLETNYAGEYSQGVEDVGADADAKTRTYTERWAKMELPGFQAKDTWISPSNTVYVLGVADVESVLETLKKFDGLSERQKKVIDDHEADMRTMLEKKG
jgi:hypothetical protein